MNIWILNLDETALPEQEGELPLPLPPLPNFTTAINADEIRHRLRARDPSLAPESAARQAERIWKYVRELHPEDILAVPVEAGARIAFFEALNRPRFARIDENGGTYHLPVRRHPRTLPASRFRKDASVFHPTTEPLRELQDRRLRTLIRDTLRLPGSRFARWKWILAIVIAIKIFYFALHMWQNETTGF